MAQLCGAAEDWKEAGQGDQDGAESEEAGGKRLWAGGWWPRACSLTMTVAVLQIGGGLGKVGLGGQHHVFVLQPLTWAVVSVAIGSDRGLPGDESGSSLQGGEGRQWRWRKCMDQELAKSANLAGGGEKRHQGCWLNGYGGILE